MWSSALTANRARFDRPALLRFAVDDFMGTLRDTLARDPSALDGYRVRPETWKSASAWAKTAVPGLSEAVKLYQPAHQRFYLVTASLVCRMRGLPDRRVQPQQQERAAIVIRRVEPTNPQGTVDITRPKSFRELAWCGPAAGWTDLEGGLPEGTVEEELPMFPVTFPVERALDTRRTRSARSGRRNGRSAASRPSAQRTVWAALLPVGRREEYETAPGAPAVEAEDLDGDTTFSDDPRWNRIRATALLALQALREKASEAGNATDEEDLRDALVFAVLDLLDLFDDELPLLYNRIASGSTDASGLPAAQRTLFVHLRGTTVQASDTWLDVMQAVQAAAADVRTGAPEAALGALDPAVVRDAIVRLGVFWPGHTARASETAFYTGLRDVLAATEEPALDDPAARPPDGPPPVQVLEGSQYIVRCIYERPRCAPHETRTVSAPSRLFTMASFFDPEAPARPLKVALPVDPSVSSLRNSAKGVSFLFSEQLRKQVQRVQDVTLEDLDNGDLNDGGGVSIGMICSLSIPIITICALILLLIIVNLLNIVFWWLPYFKICFPIPMGSSD
jgi:hypothetical protein